MTIDLNSLLATMKTLAQEFRARAEEDAAFEGAFICSTPWAVVCKDGADRAALIDGSDIRTVAVRPHLCGFSTMSRECAEQVAELLGEHFEIALVRDLAERNAEHLEQVAANMEIMMAANG
jgi:hypothetical protein